jgi:type I restriction enzyme S subunit
MIAHLLSQDAEVTFAPMDALADGLGGLDTSLTRPLSEVASGSYNFFADGDLLLAKVTPCFENGKKAFAKGLTNGIGFATSEVHVIRPDARRIDPRYFFYVLSAEDFRAAGMASMTGAGGLRRVSEAAVLNYRPLVSDLPTQKAIADFLDRETARIDRLIEKKKRLIILLNERSLAAIEEAISVSGRPSKLGHHIKIIPGYAFPSASFSTDDSDIRLLRGANVSPGAIRWDEVVYWPHELAGGLERFRLAAGDIVMGMDRPWVSGGIRVAELTSADVPSLLLQRVCKIIPLKTLAKEFLKLLLASKKFLGYFEPELTGVSVPHISGDQIAGFRFPYIPVEEQIERARSCGAVLASNARILSVAEKSIERLREFRAALITASVTGQIDVATWGRRGEPDRRLDAIEREMAS